MRNKETAALSNLLYVFQIITTSSCHLCHQDSSRYFYFPVQENGYKIKIEPLDRKPVVYIRLTSNRIKKKGRFTEVIKTGSQQDRIKIETKKFATIVTPDSTTTGEGVIADLKNGYIKILSNKPKIRFFH